MMTVMVAVARMSHWRITYEIDREAASYDYFVHKSQKGESYSQSNLCSQSISAYVEYVMHWEKLAE